MRLDWQTLPGTNAPDYYKNFLLATVKSFITLAPIFISFVFLFFFDQSIVIESLFSADFS